ncbi:helix-turn-helix domain-containing protein [Streptomyces sp. NPDC020379]|uniref:helix-turn-helix domain-containing protein n=1 Tax=Streptomyces sp. NPDC020379 TaxID=3365071 RepID=UPI0037BB7934
MARGSADFDGDALRVLRTTRSVDGRLLSAAALAARVGTSKARILSYERGRSVPEPARIAQLAHVFDVSPGRLSASDARHLSLRDLRVHAGLTAAEIAKSLDVSRTTYRDIERLARLPVRDDGTLRRLLAVRLGVPRTEIDHALHHHPLAIARRAQITDHLAEVFTSARERDAPTAVAPDDSRMVAIGSLVQRAPTVVCRLVNHELSRYRWLLRDAAMAGLDAAYAQSERAAEQAGARQRRITEMLETAPVRSADRLSDFLSVAMSAKQWRTMVSLSDAGAEGIAPHRVSEEDEVWDALLDRSFVNLVVRADGSAFALSRRGQGVMRAQFRMYACLYPRVATPVRFRSMSMADRSGRRRGRRSAGK